MNRKVFATLEFNKVIDQLSQLARTQRGRQKCLRLSPLTDQAAIDRLLQETEDALSRIFANGTPNLSDVADLRLYEKRLEIGSSLNAPELLSVASLLEVARRLDSYGHQKKEDAPADSLDPLFDSLSPLPELAREINRCILSEEEYADDATPGLQSVRRKMVSVNEKVRSTLSGMLAASSMRDYLQDALITTRGGRYCLPVKAECKSSVPGMVHDQSASGSTLFIEPMAVVALNNQLRELEVAEQEEIEKLLTALSAEVYVHAAELSATYKALIELDFIFARGQLARLQNAVRPLWNADGVIRLRKARHPLLDPKKVVPIDLALGDSYHLLIVTGPNTGGKTVSLKTCGLLALMGQSGLLIPAGDRSELSVFHNIYADIGDEQSIEQSLSTFSSHMTNIVRILDGIRDCTAAGHRTLVLFDELCAGTDPTEGAALATAILDHLRGLSVSVMATTHYSELKVYALATEGVENACCEFSLETLSPTYRLLIGIPGKSNAFAISRRLGLPAVLIDDAAARVDTEDAALEDVMADLTQKHVAADAALEESRARLREAEERGRALTQQQEKLESQRSRILSDAHLEAARILSEAKETADETIRAFRKYGAGSADMSRMERERGEIGRKLSEARAKTAVGTGTSSTSVADALPASPNKMARPLQVGDRVRVLSMNAAGTVHALADKNGLYEIQMGILRSRLPVDDLVLNEEEDTTLEGAAIPGRQKRNIYQPGRQATGENQSFGKAASVSTEIQLLGMNTEDALSALEKYLDDAFLAHLPTVRVVHGKGSGVLRKAVHRYLKTQPHVAAFELAAYGEGDSGVTVVTFR